MPLRTSWQLNREGVTIDTFGRLFYRTALNPLNILPLVLLSRYSQKGQALALEHGTALKNLKLLLAWGVLQRLANFLSDRVQNNWSSDKYDWNKEIVVVTGGSDGIGSYVVKYFAERNVKVAVLDVQPLTFEAPPTVKYFKCDLSSRASIVEACDAIKSELGNPTVLINNAGVARGKSLLDSTERDIRLTFNVNSISHYFLTQQFLPHMIKTNHGMIVTVASAAAYVTAPNMVDYASSKAAALAFHEGLSAELSTTYNAPKVRTIVVCQGFTRTKLFQGFGEGDPFVNYALYPETVAEEIVKAVYAGRSRHIMLPGAGRYITMAVKGWSEWMQYGLRKGTVKLMKKWDGRQVIKEGEEKFE